MSVTGEMGVWFLRLLRCFDRDRTAAFSSWLVRLIGPRLRGHQVAKAQLATAFPDKTDAELDRILAGMWDNLGRIAAEYAHLDRLWDYDRNGNEFGRIIVDEATSAQLSRLHDKSKPMLVFCAHLANWEIVPLSELSVDRKLSIVFRDPGVGFFTKALITARDARVVTLLPAGPDAPYRIRDTLKRNWIVAMLVDQHAERGVDVTFFGRPCKVNPMLARFARRFDCPVHGARAVRLPDNRFRFEMTAPLDPPRDADGEIDVAGTMQLITTIIEGWVREHPEQWLWIHRRWR